MNTKSIVSGAKVAARAIGASRDTVAITAVVAANLGARWYTGEQHIEFACLAWATREAARALSWKNASGPDAATYSLAAASGALVSVEAASFVYALKELADPSVWVAAAVTAPLGIARVTQMLVNATGGWRSVGRSYKAMWDYAGDDSPGPPTRRKSHLRLASRR